MRTFRLIVLRVVAALAVLLLAAGLAAILVFRSGWFREKVRERIVAEVERATGGRVELGEFNFAWENLSARVSPFILHGKESADEPPLLRVASVTVGLRILSAWERKVDLANLQVERPQVRIVFYADGANNLPTPPHPRPETSWAEDILNVAIKHWEITDGLFEDDDREIPLNLRGEDFAAQINFDARKDSYIGKIQSERVRVLPNGVAPIELGVTADFQIERNRMVFPRLTIVDKDSRAELTGTLEDPRAPRGSFQVKASIQARDAVRTFNVPVKPVGSGTFDGTLNISFAKPFTFTLEGMTTAKGLGYERERVKIDGADTQWHLRVTQSGLSMSNGFVKAWGAEIHGNLTYAEWKHLHMEGTVDGLDARRAAAVLTDQSLPWNGILRGTFALDTTLDTSAAKSEAGAVARANLTVLPVNQGPTVDGLVDVNYNQASGKLALGQSYLATPTSRLDVAGTLGETLTVKFRSTDLDDVLPALAMVDGAPKTLPLKLMGGAAEADGTISGPLENPVFRGHLAVNGAAVQGHAFDRFEASMVEASRNRVRSGKFTLARGSAQAAGSAEVQARAGSFDDGALSGTVALSGISIAEALKEAGQQAPVTGLLAGNVRVNGTVQNPLAEATFDVAHPAAYGEEADRIHAVVRYTQDAVEISAAQVVDGPAQVQFSGAYRHSGADWRTGDVKFKVAGQNLAAGQIEAIAKLQPPVGGTLGGTVEAAGHVQNAKFTLNSADGTFAVDRFTYDKQPVGNLKVVATTQGQDLRIQVKGAVRESTVEGEGSWKLAGDEQGSVTVRFSRMNVQSVHHLAMLGGTGEQEASDLPFEGFIQGHATATVPLEAPRNFQAEVTLDAVQLRPKPSTTPKAMAPVTDIELHNTKPVVIAINLKGADIRSADLAGRDTTIEATGAIPFDSGANADLNVRGDLNLTILQLLSPDLTAKGNATMQASVRGALRDPLVNGRMELKGASLYFGDLPNGLDNANGIVLFDRKRATIENLSAETGGGKLTLSGLIEFGPSIVYRLQADAKAVRVRWPEDLSTTFDAKLALNGSPDQSVLSGALTLERATFNARADLGQFFAASTKPVPTTGQPNDLLRGMQFDVRVDSGSNFQFQTSLTRDVEAEVSLRLRGSPLRPVLLGDISVNQGEIQLFGNKYTVNRGDIHFLNPVKIEPALDMELETKAHGITVSVNFSGTVDKLKVNYSSDPPLQSNEIIALLAVGRDPTGAATIASGSPAAGGAGFSDTGLGLLGEAASEQLSSRLQRFIGSSHVKIDPTMTGGVNLPQARLTVEQQLSRDITLTYITNLNRTQEQIVRVEWDFSRKWSAIAVRDSNGLFGIDFQYRKRF